VLLGGGWVALAAGWVGTGRRQALVVGLGNPVRYPIVEPGLNFKIPIVEEVKYSDKRIRYFNNEPEEVPTRDQKQVIVDAFARYRIVDPLEFYKAVSQGDTRALDLRLESIINSNLRQILGGVDLSRILTKEREEIMGSIAGIVTEEAGSFGVEVIDVRIKRVDLPKANSEAVFQRMKTQRQQEARKTRAEGEAEAKRIRADADKQERIILAEAGKQEQILRGEGEAEAERIFIDAYGRDEEFFEFYRAMQAMRVGLDSTTTQMVLPPSGDFFRFFRNLEGGAQ